MKHFIFVLLTTLVANSSNVFASYELSCNEVIGSRAKINFEKDLLQFSSKESTINQQGMRDLLKAAGASSLLAEKYSNIQLSFESDDFRCSDLQLLSVDVQCKVMQPVLNIKARQYKHSANESFDNYKIELSSLIVRAKKSKLQGNTLVSISVKAKLPSGNTIDTLFKYHLFRLEGGHNARCFMNKTFEIL